ncbi:MAG: SiaC family regulatory phosphoprotein, partial [Bacteroidia bacterium]
MIRCEIQSIYLVLNGGTVLFKYRLLASTPTTPTQVDIQLEYFNTASSKCILDVLKRLETIHRQGNQV